MDFDELKSKLDIKDILEADGYHLSGTGRYRRASQHDSLVVDLRNQRYYWNSTGEEGDIITWTMKRTGADFKGAVELLCRKAGLPDPNWKHEDMETRVATRTKQDIYSVAVRVFREWFLANQAAIDYAKGRGWSDDTIETAKLGYTGDIKNRDALIKKMRQEIDYAGLKVDSPAAVAIMGWTGDVKKWGAQHKIEVDDKWISSGRIPGLIGRDMLIYPHLKFGQVVYLSGRGIAEKTHYNVPEALIGPRQPYINTEWASDAFDCVIVEGQACAITLAQWGIPALALAGTYLDENLMDRLKGHSALYLAMDADKAGRKNVEKNLERLGKPLIRTFEWGDEDSQEGDTDANDWLKSMIKANIPHDEQVQRAKDKIAKSQTWVELVCLEAGKQRGARGEEAIKKAMELVAQMDDVTISQFRAQLSEGLKIGVRDFQNLLKTIRQTYDKNSSGKLEEVDTLGGYIDGWLVEYLYDPEGGTTKLAYRSPEGEIGERAYLDIEGKRYYPKDPNAFVEQEAVLFPSRLGPVKPTRELVGIIESYINSVYLWPDKIWPKLVSYYVLLTWVYDCFNAIPYLRAMGEAGAGKSEMMKRVGHVCYRMMTASGANTASTFFRATEMYRGTVFIDEADLHDGGDMANDIIKFLNLGAMKGNFISRTVEALDRNGNRTFDVQPFNTYCPKLIAMRKEFKDDAVSTRSLTMQLIPREPLELKQAGVRLSMNNEMRQNAREIRNMALRWRLMHWEKEIEILEDDIDLEISSRLNQVATPILKLAEGDAGLKDDIRSLLRSYNSDIILTRSMTVLAKVVEAIWTIWITEDKDHIFKDKDEEIYTHPGDVAKIANDLMDRENALDDEEDDQQTPNRKRGLTSPGVGRYMKNDLGLIPGGRRNTGIAYYFKENENRLLGLAKRYGVNLDDIRENHQKMLAAKPPEQKTIPF